MRVAEHDDRRLRPPPRHDLATDRVEASECSRLSSFVKRSRAVGERALVDQVGEADVVAADRHRHDRGPRRNRADLRREQVGRRCARTGHEGERGVLALLCEQVRVGVDAALARVVERVAAGANTRGVAVAERDIPVATPAATLTRTRSKSRCRKNTDDRKQDEDEMPYAAGRRRSAHDNPPSEREREPTRTRSGTSSGQGAPATGRSVVGRARAKRPEIRDDYVARRPPGSAPSGFLRMELAGLEPATSWVRSRRSPN